MCRQEISSPRIVKVRVEEFHFHFLRTVMITGEEMRKLFLVEDHPVMRQQYAAFIERESTLVICGEAVSVKEALEKIPPSAPDIVIIDISLEGNQDGIDLVRTLRSQYPYLRLLVVSGHEGRIYSDLIVQAGADGYVVKGNPNNFIQAIYQILDNGEFFSPCADASDAT
jgi:DNA-binding NarL/FixJ family response regulator